MSQSHDRTRQPQWPWLPPRPAAPPAPSAARLVSRWLPRARRNRLTAALHADRVHVLQADDVLDPARLPALARDSLWLLLGAGVAYTALDQVARTINHAPPLLGTSGGGWRLAALVAVNIGAYLTMVPAHEGLHALAILALGGRPRFGLRLPWAAYCTAPGQLFTRNGYLLVAYAPLVALSLAGVAVTWLLPNLGAYLWLGWVGNVAGAVGDLAVAQQIRRLPSDALIADTETGYVAYQVEQPA